MFNRWSIRPSLKYIPAIIAIGIAIGVANYAMGTSLTMGQTLLLQAITSFCIGFPLVLIATNAKHSEQEQPNNQRFIGLGLLFAAIGVVASEIELLTRALL